MEHTSTVLALAHKCSILWLLARVPCALLMMFALDLDHFHGDTDTEIDCTLQAGTVFDYTLLHHGCMSMGIKVGAYYMLKKPIPTFKGTRGSAMCTLCYMERTAISDSSLPLTSFTYSSSWYICLFRI